MTTRILIVDALAAGRGRRTSSRDSIGCGPRTVAGIFECNHIECRIIRSEDIRSRKQLKQYDHLAVSAMTMDLPAVRRVIAAWRRMKNRGLVFLGGPIASSPQRILKTLRPDLLVIGEAEETLTELIRKGIFTDSIDLSEVNGVGFVSDGNIVITAARAPIPEEHLDDYRPSVARIIDYPAYQAGKVYVEVLRGCSNFRRTRLRLADGRECIECGDCDSDDPFVRLNCPMDIPPGCGFCSVPATWGPPRSRTHDAIVQEIKGLLELGVHRIVLEAPDFLDYRRGIHPLTDPCHPPANLDAISSLLQDIVALPEFAAGTAHLAIENIKACLFTEEVARVIASATPSTSPNIGLETGSETHARLIGKSSLPSDVMRAVKIARAHGMSPFVYLIYGLPGETAESVEESIQLMYRLDELGAERIILYGFRSLPNSAFAGLSEPGPHDPFGVRMKTAARDINRRRKTEYVGQIVRGVVAEPSWDRLGYSIVYPLGEGPIMTVHGGYSPGTVVDVKITKVLSEGLLLGTVVKES